LFGFGGARDRIVCAAIWLLPDLKIVMAFDSGGAQTGV